MASQKKPPTRVGPDGAGGSSVRRAVSLGSAAADPGPVLAPAVRRTPTPEPGEGGTGGARAARPAPETTGTADEEAAPGRGAATGSTEEPAARPTGATASASRQGQEARSESAAEPAAAARTASDAEAEGAAGAGETAAAGADGADGPPSGNPKKPLLAAAGIAGVVLLAVPLLIWATDDSRQKRDEVAVAAGADTLLEEEALEVPKGDYAPAEPTVEPTPEPTPEPSTQKPSAEPKPVVVQPDPVPSPVVTDKPAGTVTKKAEPRIEEHKAPQLPPNTAAYAVQRLAASSPGRHICYRVHAKGAGWTAPVCDGATAGQEGRGRPVTAINIAVADAKKVNGNEFIQKDGWTTEWSSAADGTDLTLGSAASNAPNLSGFTIGVGSGNVCQNHKLGKHAWGGLACQSPQGWIFGGSTEPQFWLEAVRFTV
ncbi:hypothetical protein ACVV2G_09870 [Streptomyces ziwulingensis]